MKKTIKLSCMSPQLVRTYPHIVENRGITMAPLILRLIQGIPAFRDFRIRDPRYFVIHFQGSNSWIPLYFVILKKKVKKKSKKNWGFFRDFLMFFRIFFLIKKYAITFSALWIREKIWWTIKNIFRMQTQLQSLEELVKQSLIN